MSGPSSRHVVAELLSRHGRTFAAEAGIPLARATPSPLFRLLCLALLVSARIRSSAAVSAARALAAAGWTTPGKLAESTWRQRTDVLNRAGYARYDESTARYLADAAGLLLEGYQGDLRRLRDEAGGDVGAARQLLQQFKGIGRTGADVYLREVQAAWTEYAPFADERSLGAAGGLGLPTDALRLRSLVPDDDTWTRLVAALVRSRLAGDGDDVVASARKG